MAKSSFDYERSQLEAEARQKAQDLIEQRTKEKKEQTANRTRDFRCALMGAAFAFLFEHARDIFRFLVNLFHQ